MGTAPAVRAARRGRSRTRGDRSRRTADGSATLLRTSGFDTAAFRCPHCETLIHESHKPAMVGAGTWRATHPEVTGHHGYRLNSLVSLLPNVSWTVLAREFLQAKDHRDRLMSFITTKLAEPWREQADESSEGELAARAHRGRDRHHNCSPLSGRDREKK